ncbi:uncharacterized protein M6B38_141430 [Iris pallida]|uniref:Uncharacterized protein n=1 Tax=Iris pallida TaxID=29817 RepID=A0AAX6FC68_IRIPA|nr:uncharacterized protein M6B38_141430 [Iris pallida]
MHIDLGSSISIIPKSQLQLLGIPMHRLAATNTVISGFNLGRSYSLGKIRLKCQIGDLKTEATCYVIEVDTPYNILLGRQWIHDYMIVPSTLHQCFKYVNRHGLVRTEFADIVPFKGVESYYSSEACLYEESKKYIINKLETITGPKEPSIIHLQTHKSGKSAPLVATLHVEVPGSLVQVAESEPIVSRLPHSRAKDHHRADGDPVTKIHPKTIGRHKIPCRASCHPSSQDEPATKSRSDIIKQANISSSTPGGQVAQDGIPTFGIAGGSRRGRRTCRIPVGTGGWYLS